MSTILNALRRLEEEQRDQRESEETPAGEEGLVPLAPPRPSPVRRLLIVGLSVTLAAATGAAVTFGALWLMKTPEMTPADLAAEAAAPSAATTVARAEPPASPSDSAAAPGGPSPEPEPAMAVASANVKREPTAEASVPVAPSDPRADDDEARQQRLPPRVRAFATRRPLPRVASRPRPEPPPSDLPSDLSSPTPPAPPSSPLPSASIATEASKPQTAAGKLAAPVTSELEPMVEADDWAASAPSEVALAKEAQRSRPFIDTAPAEVPTPLERAIAAEQRENRIAPSRPAEPTARASAPPPAEPDVRQVVRKGLPELVVRSTVWHPQPGRREVMVDLIEEQGTRTVKLREGDRLGPLLLEQIRPSGVTFLHDGVEIQHRVGGGR